QATAPARCGAVGATAPGSNRALPGQDVRTITIAMTITIANRESRRPARMLTRSPPKLGRCRDRPALGRSGRAAVSRRGHPQCAWEPRARPPTEGPFPEGPPAAPGQEDFFNALWPGATPW